MSPPVAPFGSQGFTLLHGLPSGPAPHEKRLLLLTHAFAPSRIVGALRWTRMVELLARHDFVFDVVSVATSASTAERALLERLPRGTRVFTVPEPPAGRWNRMLASLVRYKRWGSRPFGVGAWASRPATSAAAAPVADGNASTGVARAVAREVRRNLIFRAHDEVEVRWAEAAAKAACAHLDLGGYRGIVSSGPPHFIHVMAGRLAQSADRPHIADLRDPWAHWSWLGEEYSSPLFLKIRRPREASVVRGAALVTTTTERQSDALRRAYPASAAKVHTILNGTDEAALPPASEDGVFRIAFAGLLYLDRNPSTLFRAIRGFLDVTGATPDQVKVEFMGDVEMIGERPVREIADKAGISAWLTLTPSRPRAEAMALLARSHVFINFAERLRETIAAKIFEYVRFPAWILLIGPEDSATHDILSGSHAFSAAPDDVAAMQRHLETAYASWKSGGRPQPISQQLALDRHVHVERFATLLDQLFGPSGSA